MISLTTHTPSQAERADLRGPGPDHTGRKPWPRRARRGVGIFQVILGLAVGAIVIAGAVGLYSSTTGSIRAQAVQTTVAALEAEIRKAFANQREYTDEDYEDFVAPRMPSSAIRGAAGSEEIITPWGGEITASGGTTIGADNDSPDRFWIRIDELPRDACIAVAETFLDRRDVWGLDPDGTFAAMATQPTVTLTTIETACDDANDNDIGIVFRG